jgi:hypothetical protein
MVAVMRFWWIILSLVLFGSVSASAEDEPSFEAFMALIEQALNTAGPGNQSGDRSELFRFTETGWEIRMMTLWDGDQWRLLALRMHHPERIDEAEGQWQERYDRLLASIDRDRLPELLLPDLFDVPPPDYNPALPEELRSRSFTHDGFWYEVRWFNAGGVDDRARWALRSYELVALPHRRR